jgi:hypothetical protein
MEELFAEPGEAELIEDERLLRILEIIGRERVIGARVISEALGELGYDLSESAVRYHLRKLDEGGFTERIGFDGRVLTEKGRDELRHSRVGERLGSALYEMEEKIHQMDFDLESRSGKILVSRAAIPPSSGGRALDLMKKAYRSGLLIAPYFRRTETEKGEIKISFPAALTYDGIFLRSGILPYLQYFGILEVRKGSPTRFNHIFGLAHSSYTYLDFHLTRGGMETSAVVESGNGLLYATFREVPKVATERVVEIIEKLHALNFGGIVKIGRPGRPLLGVPVSPNRVGIVIASSFNFFSLLEESGVSLRRKVGLGLETFSRMERLPNGH